MTPIPASGNIYYSYCLSVKELQKNPPNLSKKGVSKGGGEIERLKGQVIKRKKNGINILKDCIRDREHKI